MDMVARDRCAHYLDQIFLGISLGGSRRRVLKESRVSGSALVRMRDVLELEIYRRTAGVNRRVGDCEYSTEVWILSFGPTQWTHSVDPST